MAKPDRPRNCTTTRVKIWLIGGTQDSAQLAEALVAAQLPTVVTVTTAAARSLYPTHPLLQVQVGILGPESMAGFLQEQTIGGILDASHPFATVVSQGAIAAAALASLPYIRYERTPLGESLAAAQTPDFDPQDLPLGGHRVLLVVGYRLLPQFQIWHDRATLFARILPSEIALKTALDSGFSGRNLVALRPPVSLELERSLWRQWDISLVVAKASGTAGGEAVKRQVAQELEIPLILIPRPWVAYPQQTGDRATAIALCQQALHQSLPSPD